MSYLLSVTKSTTFQKRVLASTGIHSHFPFNKFKFNYFSLETSYSFSVVYIISQQSSPTLVVPGTQSPLKELRNCIITTEDSLPSSSAFSRGGASSTGVTTLLSTSFFSTWSSSSSTNIIIPLSSLFGSSSLSSRSLFCLEPPMTNPLTSNSCSSPEFSGRCVGKFLASMLANSIRKITLMGSIFLKLITYKIFLACSRIRAQYLGHNFYGDLFML
ncbi:unnamed protein product [Chrysodeixis includens]|uniref:Uncharacterized protein n=1 Tax=Chrysodeixis includens TaxID=689277 RepID=A0A9P0FXN0_CHRIL|nr:unnamed protein product [Chrysodeixis includens]